MRRYVPKAAVSRCSNTSLQKPNLLDHLVGKREQVVGDHDAEPLGRLDVDHQLKLGRSHDRQVTGILAPEEPAPRGAALKKIFMSQG